MEVGKADTTDRRQFLAGGTIAATAMAGGLVAGYGMFLHCAGQYLYPSEEGAEWMFVTETAGLAPGQAKTFQSPTGIAVVVTRRGQSQGDEPTAEDFLALSSVCPHLGCRVHWEPQNDRFFCPCHLGAFDPEGPTDRRAAAGREPVAARISAQGRGRVALHQHAGQAIDRPIDAIAWRRADPAAGLSPNVMPIPAQAAEAPA